MNLSKTENSQASKWCAHTNKLSALKTMKQAFNINALFANLPKPVIYNNNTHLMASFPG